MLFLIGIVALVSYFQLTPRASTEYGWRDPTGAVASARVRLDLALLPLGGVPSDEAAREALRAGEVDTAFAITVYAVDLDVAAQAGLFQLIGERFAREGRQSEAALCFQLVHDLAALAPDMSDVARFDLTLAAARGRRLVGDDYGFELSLEQAENIVYYSALMPPAQRRRTADLLLRYVAEVKGRREMQDLQRRLSEVLDLRPVSTSGGALWLRMASPVPVDRDAELLRLARQQRALILVNQWIALEGGDVEPERLDLVEFLRREDAARSAWHQRVLTSPEVTPSQRLTVLSDRIAWLLIKWQAARGAFGLPLVPEWEENVAAIEEQLIDAQQTFFSAVRQMGRDLEPADAERLELEITRLELVRAWLGQYPGFDLSLRDEVLWQATAQVRELYPQGGGLPGSGLLPLPRIVDGRRDYVLGGGASAPAP